MRVPTRGRVGGYVGLALVLGALAGVAWNLLTPLATYTVAADGSATTAERALTTFFAADAWFSGLGLVVGIGLGTLGWRWFARGGWRVVLLVVLAGGVGRALLLGVGHLLAPAGFDERLAAAKPGDVVPIDLALRAPSTLLVWVVAAVAPVLVGSSLGRDPDDRTSEPVDVTSESQGGTPVKDHHYTARVAWTGNLGTGTSGYRDYSRDHEVGLGDKPVLPGSADRTFRGDPARYNPEELLVAALSQCHLLSYLHLCAVNGVVVTAYVDDATGTMTTTPEGGGAFTEVTLHPQVTVATGSDPALAHRLHDDAHAACFIASSVNFPVLHEVTIAVEPV